MNKFLLKTLFKNLSLGLSVCAIYFLSSQILDAQTLVTSVEAEAGTRAGGLTIATTNSGYSGSGYITNMANTGDNLTIPVSVPTAGNYKLVIRYNGPYGDKDQDVYVNGAFVSSLHFPATTGYTDLTAGSLTLNAGNNTIGIYKNWGYTDFDKITLYTVPLHDYTTVVAAPIDPAATTEVKALYNYLKSNYGQTIISGQTADYYNTVSPNAAKKPVIQAFDFSPYTVGYPYAWDNATASHTFGWQDAGTTEAAINWYNSTCQKGMVAFHWHWCSPSGGQPGVNTFYTNSTTFDVTKAVTSGTAENTAILRDIDSIATQLKKLQTAGVPVLWRPLHEAGGAWFWWGAKGSTAALSLYDILYNRLVNYHGIHNLIWQWSTPEPSWYPGNSKVDMLGYDSYPGAYNYGTQKLIFDQLYTIVNGQKILAMTENGPIPDPDACFTSDAKWAYFMSWSDLVTQQNSAAQLSLVYNHAKVITLDEIAAATNTAQLTAAGPTSFCTGGSVLLKANVAKGYTYKWYNGATVIGGATSSSYTATSAGSYTVAVTATGSCTTTSTPVAVTIGGPVATITPATTTTFCQGGSVVLNANTGSGLTYIWYKDANVISGASTSSYTATATGLYSVKVTASTCNTTSTGTQVTVNALPVITGTLNVCVGATTTLIGTGIADATAPWTSSNPTIATISNIGVVIGQSQGTSVITYKNNTGCTATATVTVSASPTITGTLNVCVGLTTQLIGSGTPDAATPWASATPAVATVSNTGLVTGVSAGTSVITYKNNTGCVKAITVTVIATPTITGTLNVCVGLTTQMIGSGTADGTTPWASATTAVATVSSTGLITGVSVGTSVITYKNSAGCTKTTTVTVDALPTAMITSGTNTSCGGVAVLMTASTGTAYKWMLNGNAISGATNVTFVGTSTGPYTVEVTNASNCKAISAPKNFPIASVVAASISPSGTIGLCNGESIVLTANTGSAYRWMNGGNVISGATNATYTTAAAGSYTVEVTNGPCVLTSTATVVTVVGITATITAGGPTSFCQGGNVVLTASSGILYKWMNGGNAISGATNATYTATASGPYTVEVSNSATCKATSTSITVTVNVQATPAIIIGVPPANGSAYCQGETASLTAIPSSANAYKWMNNGTAIQGATNVNYQPTATGAYSVEVTNASNCKATSLVSTINFTNSSTWYLDSDNDGKGDPTSAIQACTQPTGYVATAGDACPNDANKIAAGNCGCGATENSCLDCMGVPHGTAALDVCNVCAGGTSGVTPKTNLSQCTATSTISALAANVKMYPNPTVDNCMIELSGSEFRVTIYTSSGIQLSSTIYTNEAIIGNGLPQGIYLVRIEQDGNVELRKLIKQ